jgi:peptidoglycan hydrolase-like protein with peptidoglycan-binding domain
MKLRIWFLTLVIAGAAFAAVVGVAFFDWPHAQLRPADVALARVVLPGFSGRVTAVSVRGPDGTSFPVRIQAGRLWPVHKIPAGERLTLAVTVRRPGWAAWLLGKTQVRRFALRTPVATLRGTWLQVKAGGPVSVAFDVPVSLVALGGKPGKGLAHPSKIVPTGLVASGAHIAGAIEVAAVPRLWERLPAPMRVSWFPALTEPQVLSEPRPGSALAPDGRLTLTFSRPVADILGSKRPELSPAIPGRWRLRDAHTLIYTPEGDGFGLGTDVSVSLAHSVIIAGQPATALTRTLQWQVPIGSTLRLQQLLAQLGYLPLSWQPGAAAPRTTRAELLSAITAPPGHFSWRYPNTPESLKVLWSPGQSNTITRGAVMMFEHDNDLAVDGIAGPHVWNALIADTVAGKRAKSGYDYVYVHRDLPQSLNLWVDGVTILSSPGNTGVPAAPTQLGTYAVFEHIPIGTMAGTNPDGTRYNDPGIRWISYFHGGDAIHSFTRASYGTPQSLGCVELPLAAAAEVWPYTPIGTLVTVEN